MADCTCRVTVSLSGDVSIEPDSGCESHGTDREIREALEAVPGVVSATVRTLKRGVVGVVVVASREDLLRPISLLLADHLMAGVGAALEIRSPGGVVEAML